MWTWLLLACGADDPEPRGLPPVVLRPALPVGRTVTEALEGVRMEREWTVEAEGAGGGATILVSTTMPGPAPGQPPIRIEQRFVLTGDGIASLEVVRDDMAALGRSAPTGVPTPDQVILGPCGMPADAVLLPVTPVSVGESWAVGSTTRCVLERIEEGFASVRCEAAASGVTVTRELTVDLGQRLVASCEQAMTQGGRSQVHRMRATGREW